MSSAIIKTPLGPAEINGDNKGISSIKILEEETEFSTDISEDLKEAILSIKCLF